MISRHTGHYPSADGFLSRCGFTIMPTSALCRFRREDPCVYPLHYGINCAHPDHVAFALTPGAQWLRRIGMLRANAARMSHAELDAAEDLAKGDPAELASQYARLRALLLALDVVCGCCGTDQRQVAAIAAACIGQVAHERRRQG